MNAHHASDTLVPQPPAAAPPPATAPVALLRDPVCGMTVTAQSQHMLEHADKLVYFCIAGCKAKFGTNPAKYLMAFLGKAVGPVAAPQPAVASTNLQLSDAPRDAAGLSPGLPQVRYGA